MKWKIDNRVHFLSVSIDDLEHLKNGGLFTLKTLRQDLIVVKKE